MRHSLDQTSFAPITLFYAISVDHTFAIFFMILSTYVKHCSDLIFSSPSQVYRNKENQFDNWNVQWTTNVCISYPLWKFNKLRIIHKYFSNRKKF